MSALWADAPSGEECGQFHVVPYGADAQGQPMQRGKDPQGCGGADVGGACA